MAVHLILWQFRNGDRMWATSAPYDRTFVARLKAEIPGKERAWIAALKLWCVHEKHHQRLRDLISEIYPAPCPCWYDAEARCSEWERLRELAARAGGRWGAPVPWTVPAPRRPVRAPRPARPRSPVQEPHNAEDARRVLGLPSGASKTAVRAAWRRLAARAHPDAGGDHERMVAVNVAREILLGTRRV